MRSLTARATAVALLCGAMAVFTWTITPVRASAPSLSALPMALGAWSGASAPPLSPEDAAILAADEYVHRYYSGALGTIEMDVAYYAQPRVGANMHSPLNCLPGNGWEIVNMNTTSVQAAGAAWPARELIVQRGTVRYALTYWFQSRTRIVANEVSARMFLLADALRRRPVDTGLVRVMMPIQRDGISEQRILSGFSSSLIPALADHWSH